MHLSIDSTRHVKMKKKKKKKKKKKNLEVTSETWKEIFF